MLPTTMRISGVLPSVACRRLGVSPTTLRGMIATGQLTAAVTAYGHLIDPDDLERLAELREKRAATASTEPQS